MIWFEHNRAEGMKKVAIIKSNKLRAEDLNRSQVGEVDT
jgi:hypothetical protein